jgi:hypothetical protein
MNTLDENGVNSLNLHDGVVIEVSLDATTGVFSLSADIYLTEGAKNRSRIYIECRDVTDITVSIIQTKLIEHAAFGNINYWIPSTSDGSTVFYLADGYIFVKGSKLVVCIL